ncbi:hypothetical protein A2690_02935 [Candidatus Roizmanbacteria bacterium RIFCSPHIGHO2_01_FULL_39_12b]|uniref:Uncharacterized protein n=1 Tax=Candidatus Roizmanbacteria bacterium RIFCSPHIGHO2_01_FULL_39_12b TaxID=1802030 RepID=A0A1F7G814_9BACT|nr:MAG: hypothetical protein A2690_02935 [Candidatus Roizmanbacteria bacterium RIFCSPHIGHO2_01_FULL_39_12b]
MPAMKRYHFTNRYLDGTLNFLIGANLPRMVLTRKNYYAYEMNTLRILLVLFGILEELFNPEPCLKSWLTVIQERRQWLQEIWLNNIQFVKVH